jgi:hypothetical protein
MLEKGETDEFISLENEIENERKYVQKLEDKKKQLERASKHNVYQTLF